MDNCKHSHTQTSTSDSKINGYNTDDVILSVHTDKMVASDE